jgi:hypothetical protein
LKNETQSNAEAGTITQRSCLCGGGFKRSRAMLGSSGDDHSIVVDSGDRFGCFWPLFPLLVLRKLRGTGRKARLAGVLRKCWRQFVCAVARSRVSDETSTKLMNAFAA